VFPGLQRILLKPAPNRSCGNTFHYAALDQLGPNVGGVQAGDGLFGPSREPTRNRLCRHNHLRGKSAGVDRTVAAPDAVQSLLEEALAPPRDGLSIHTQPRGDGGISIPLAAISTMLDRT